METNGDIIEIPSIKKDGGPGMTRTSDLYFISSNLGGNHQPTQQLSSNMNQTRGIIYGSTWISIVLWHTYGIPVKKTVENILVSI